MLTYRNGNFIFPSNIALTCYEFVIEKLSYFPLSLSSLWMVMIITDDDLCCQGLVVEGVSQSGQMPVSSRLQRKLFISYTAHPLLGRKHTDCGALGIFLE